MFHRSLPNSLGSSQPRAATAAIWVGGYALLVLVIIPTIRKDPSETLIRITISAVRTLTCAGTLTILLGILLITRTRGFSNIRKGEWGAGRDMFCDRDRAAWHWR